MHKVALPGKILYQAGGEEIPTGNLPIDVIITLKLVKFTVICQ